MLAAGDIGSGPDGQIGHAVAVQIAQRRHRTAELVVVRERGSAVGAAGDLHAALHRAVGVQELHIDRSAIRVRAARVIKSGPDGQIGHAISVQVPQRRDGIAEAVIVREYRAAANTSGNFDTLRAIDGAVADDLRGP